jgi:undecaprenyl phosphate-alpha-L-ara4N flippase subunit ArnF
MISFLVIILTLITVAGDYFIKRASLRQGYSGWNFLLIGALIYALTAFGWFYLFRKIKLANSTAIYGASAIIFLTLIGFFIFGEKLKFIEVIGILMAIGSIILLSRFA